MPKNNSDVSDKPFNVLNKPFNVLNKPFNVSKMVFYVVAAGFFGAEASSGEAKELLDETRG
jgi:hypothetical protein